MKRDDFPIVFLAGAAASCCCSDGILLSMFEPPNAIKNLSGPRSTAGADLTAGFSLSISASAADWLSCVEAFLALFIDSIHFWKSC